MLSGEVEVDETYVGGKGVNRAKQRKDIENNKQIVVGIVERKGKAKVKHVKSAGARVLLPEVKKNVEPRTKIYSDEWRAYKGLKKLGFSHSTVNHGGLEFVRGSSHTQNVENLWSHIKRGITGVYRHVDSKYLQSYVDEYTFRYSHRHHPTGAMFDLIIRKISV